MSKALAAQDEEVESGVLLKSGATSVEYNFKALTAEANNSFDVQRAAEINAQRSIALLNINMKTDDLRQQLYEREEVRQLKLKKFKDKQQTLGKEFLSLSFSHPTWTT
ncbi:hypothetical protein B484DRAFT_426247 [Ochromonadaceae sp. CCMP2298]|nr:hypothetical protein B484DRAFT_426247 [Ochromonadaceae sp. CCMP2298]